jgi:hypothetical protein
VLVKSTTTVGDVKLEVNGAGLKSGKLNCLRNNNKAETDDSTHFETKNKKNVFKRQVTLQNRIL